MAILQHQARREALMLGMSWPGLTMHSEKLAMKTDMRSKGWSELPSTARNTFAANLAQELPCPVRVSTSYGCARKRVIFPQLFWVSATKPSCRQATFLTQASPW